MRGATGGPLGWTIGWCGRGTYKYKVAPCSRNSGFFHPEEPETERHLTGQLIAFRAISLPNHRCVAFRSFCPVLSRPVPEPSWKKSQAPAGAHAVPVQSSSGGEHAHMLS